jgi:hypothetical protein
VLIEQVAPPTEADDLTVTNITNFLSHSSGFDFAAMDNTDPYSHELGCQTKLLRVPAGWEIASGNLSLGIGYATFLLSLVLLSPFSSFALTSANISDVQSEIWHPLHGEPRGRSSQPGECPSMPQSRGS